MYSPHFLAKSHLDPGLRKRSEVQALKKELAAAAQAWMMVLKGGIFLPLKYKLMNCSIMFKNI